MYYICRVSIGCGILYFYSLHIEIKEVEIQESVAETTVEETKTEQDIYEAQGYAAIPMEEPVPEGEEEGGYFESGYMTLPDEDPDEDKRTIVYPENYEEIAGMRLYIFLLARFTP